LKEEKSNDVFFCLFVLEDIEPSLKRQLVVSTVLMTPVLFVLAHTMLPEEFDLAIRDAAEPFLVKSWHVFAAGFWSGLLIEFITEYYTSHSYT